MTGRGGPGEVADLGDQDRRGDRADPVDAFDALDLPAAGMIPEEMSDRRGELVNLVVEGVDEHDDRFDALPER